MAFTLCDYKLLLSPSLKCWKILDKACRFSTHPILLLRAGWLINTSLPVCGVGLLNESMSINAPYPQVPGICHVMMSFMFQWFPNAYQELSLIPRRTSPSKATPSVCLRAKVYTIVSSTPSDAQHTSVGSPTCDSREVIVREWLDSSTGGRAPEEEDDGLSVGKVSHRESAGS